MSIRLENVSYIYNKNISNETRALSNINLEINKGEFIGIIGHTGSGKSTLIQLLNGLEKPTEGTVYYNDCNIGEKNFDLKELRCNVGLVFQYPEYQLFEETVIKDVCFGPKNQGLSEEEAVEKAKRALSLVGINEEVYNLSPFELSGGQKRRVAIAGVLAMEPKILILDEPTAGLDPKGRDNLLEKLEILNKEYGLGIVLVSHSMDDVARFVSRLIVMNNGKIQYDDSVKNIFSKYKKLEEIGLAAPQLSYVMHKLKENGMDIDENIFTLEEAKEEIIRAIGK